MTARAAALGAAVALLGVLLLAGAGPVRVDRYDARGQRRGYAVTRPDGRVDVYDARSRRQGYGRVRPDGSVDLFDARGNRIEAPAVIVPAPRPDAVGEGRGGR